MLNIIMACSLLVTGTVTLLNGDWSLAAIIFGISYLISGVNDA